ncbi:FAD-binding oxidoreductase [Erythrobacter sp. LQ02-29]|nr:FAD-binding oxidoreductase [Erythrobacter sp. LQ02-29]
MAGASLAAECAPNARVLLLEAEERPGYHTTGRSAAFWEECYGGPAIVPLTLASGAYLRDGGFLKLRGAMTIGQSDDAGLIDAFVNRFSDTGATIERIGAVAMRARLPDLLPEWTEGVWQPHCSDIDVAALHQHYLALAARAGTRPLCRARIARIERNAERWAIADERGRSWQASAIVNAAGAWADEVARMAGARALGIQPLRRTVAQVETDPPTDPAAPLVLDINGRFYFKPESGRLWLSPHDETPSPAVDAAPEEIAIAEAIERYQQTVDAKVTRVERRWAGLRSFSPDRAPVYGWDPTVDGFFWFAGQGGFGIQTAPAAARLASQLLLDAPRDAMTAPLDAGLYRPGRFA